MVNILPLSLFLLPFNFPNLCHKIMYQPKLCIPKSPGINIKSSFSQDSLPSIVTPFDVNYKFKLK